MKQSKFFLALVLTLALNVSYSQIGIGTTTPKTTLQVEGNPANTTTADGIQGPSLSLAELDAKIAAYGADQDGAIVYIDDVTTASTTTQTANITATSYYYYDAPNGVFKKMGSSTYSVGDFAHGGIVFWLDATGQHGLIAATTDQSTGIKWYNGTYRYTGTTGDGLYAGAMNTTMIVATQMADNQTGNFAAKVCADYSVTVGGVTYGDWYLPSKYELNLLYLQKTAVGGFASAYYWSSGENGSHTAWLQTFANGSQTTSSKGSPYYVRAIRAF